MSVPVEDSLCLLVPEVEGSTTFRATGNSLPSTQRVTED